jgi:hypothetical protein
MRDAYEQEKENLRKIGLGEDWLNYPGGSEGLPIPEINWRAVSAANDRRSRGKAALQEEGLVRNVPPRRAEEGLPPTPEIDWRQVSRENDSRNR